MATAPGSIRFRANAPSATATARSLSVSKKPISVRAARAALASQDEARRDAVLAELEAIAGSEITDILAWDNLGRVDFKSSADLSPGARKAIKKVKVSPTQHGQSIEVEMHDKMASLRLLAKHYGLLEQDAGANRPSLIGINLKGPDVTTYEVIDETLEQRSNPPNTHGEKDDSA